MTRCQKLAVLNLPFFALLFAVLVLVQLDVLGGMLSSDRHHCGPRTNWLSSAKSLTNARPALIVLAEPGINIPSRETSCDSSGSRKTTGTTPFD